MLFFQQKRQSKIFSKYSSWSWSSSSVPRQLQLSRPEGRRNRQPLPVRTVGGDCQEFRHWGIDGANVPHSDVGCIAVLAWWCFPLQSPTLDWVNGTRARFWPKSRTSWCCFDSSSSWTFQITWRHPSPRRHPSSKLCIRDVKIKVSRVITDDGKSDTGIHVKSAKCIPENKQSIKSFFLYIYVYN